MWFCWYGFAFCLIPFCFFYHFYPLTAPLVIPDIIFFWNTNTIMTRGTVAIDVAANITRLGFHSAARLCGFWTNLKIALGTVCLMSDVNHNCANKSSFHDLINTKMKQVNSPGKVSGKITFQKICIREAPSTFAAFQRSSGISSKKDCRTNTASGKLRAV